MYFICNSLNRYWADDSGGTVIDYALISACIGMVIIVGADGVINAVKDQNAALQLELDCAMSSSSQAGNPDCLSNELDVRENRNSGNK